ncbi:hypothetical protein C0Q70_21361 [Pomacea canaliculata]|uniref:Uncharacterized protein n=1 Tax=Pomacea canaliculata TaxID=400727 RepID=A0A2T7NCB0_POMCA|nr:hypothetical protein C0Q70_21361 [Pomacea canaliculata]
MSLRHRDNCSHTPASVTLPQFIKIFTRWGREIEKAGHSSLVVITRRPMSGNFFFAEMFLVCVDMSRARSSRESSQRSLTVFWRKASLLTARNRVLSSVVSSTRLPLLCPPPDRCRVLGMGSPGGVGVHG